MRWLRIMILGLTASLALAGCETATKQQAGAVIGGIAGGALGSQIGGGRGTTVAIIGGTLLGAALGGYLGQQMDENDRYRAQYALEHTPTQQTYTWENPDSGRRYAVTPTRTYESNSGPCREYSTEGWIDGRRETIYGTACRQADGSWVNTQ